LGEPGARSRALGLVLEEMTRWQRWLEQQQTLAAQPPSLKEVMETITQIIAQDTEPDPESGPGGRRITKSVAPDRRISIEDKDMRHGRKSSAKTFNGFKEHFAVDLDSKVTREVVVRPANEPEHEAVELLAEELEKAPGLLQLDIDLGYMASPGLPNGRSRASILLLAPGRKSGHCSQRMIHLRLCGYAGDLSGGPERPMIPVSMPSFRRWRVTRVPCEPNAPKPHTDKAEV